jgi:hypothetical protein
MSDPDRSLRRKELYSPLDRHLDMIQRFEVSEIRTEAKPQKSSSILIQRKWEPVTQLSITYLNDSFQELKKIFFGLTANFEK